MATRGDSPISPRRYRRANWVSSKEIHRLTSSGSAQSPNSPEELGLSLELVPPLTKDKNWYKKVSCCHLESAMGDGQGVIVCLGTDNYHQQFAEMFEVSTYPAFALITCHHVISGRSNLKNWKLVISGMEMKKFAVKLDDRKFDACRSCCGENGVLGKEEHPNKVCPFGADFTVLILTKEFANEMLKNRDLLFPVIMPLDMQSLKAALQSKRFYLFKRDKASGIIRTIEVNIHKRAPPSDDEESIEGQIEAYEKMCKLTYDKNPEVIGGDSGAGIFLTEGSERLLLGLHKSTEADEDTHTGIAIHAIFHAIASKVRGEVCGIIPSLSQLKDAKMHNLNSCAYYRNIQLCLETREGTAVQTSEEGNDLPLHQVLRIIGYLFKKNLLILAPGNELTIPSINLLTSIFVYFHERCHGHTKIKDKLRELYPQEETRGTFFDNMSKLGDQIYKLLCEPNQPPELMESCFRCWHSLSYFPHTKPIFTDSMKFGRIGNIRKSKDFERSLPVHKAFGDICLAYQLHMRDELVDVKKRKDELDQLVVKSMAQLENEKKRREMVEKRLEEVEQLSEERKVKLEELQSENDKLGQLLVETKLAVSELERIRSSQDAEIKQLQHEKQELNAENEDMSRTGILHKSLSDSPPHKSISALSLQSQASNHYPTRQVIQEDNTFEHFWKRDIAEVLNKDVALREKLAKCFVKITGSEGARTWEHLLDHLYKTKPNFKMDAAVLETRPVAEILLSVVLEWGKVGDKVTVEEFCDVSKQLGIGRVEHILHEAEKTAYDTPGVGSANFSLNVHDSDEAHV